MLAGAAAAVAMNEWNQKQERDGKPVSYVSPLSTPFIWAGGLLKTIMQS